MKRSESFIGHFGNTPQGRIEIEEARKHFRTLGFYLAVRGRGPRREIFKKTGRKYNTTCANSNDIYPTSPESQYVPYWAVYLRAIKPKKELAE